MSIRDFEKLGWSCTNNNWKSRGSNSCFRTFCPKITLKLNDYLMRVLIPTLVMKFFLIKSTSFLSWIIFALFVESGHITLVTFKYIIVYYMINIIYSRKCPVSFIMHSHKCWDYWQIVYFKNTSAILNYVFVNQILTQKLTHKYLFLSIEDITTMTKLKSNFVL